MNTFEHPVKCMECSLHFVVLSQHPDWTERAKQYGGPYCPECGGTGHMIVWVPRETDKFIFQIVPGEQSPASVGGI